MNNGSIAGNLSHQTQADHSQAELDLRIALGHELREILINKKLKQRELATLLAIQQPEVSHLFNGHFSRFTVDKLIQLFNRLGWVVKFQINPQKIDESQSE
ncbi:helix-turn-helix domain-containing protein [Vacuolonema iberomarrocanum]|uniref:helix-turn-helix domain-containing protein n=1 Tax=Vacuolonema iberomarrocanum TaxID=3454632 RepID=UPI0019E440F2|nr:XRE family transcriptional regulator [filamentous cyanobacterium LEGE 07170]